MGACLLVYVRDLRFESVTGLEPTTKRQLCYAVHIFKTHLRWFKQKKDLLSLALKCPTPPPKSVHWSSWLPALLAGSWHVKRQDLTGSSQKLGHATANCVSTLPLSSLLSPSAVWLLGDEQLAAARIFCHSSRLKATGLGLTMPAESSLLASLCMTES